MPALLLKIGHTTHEQQGTGLTVLLPDRAAACGYWLCGSAPATRDLHALNLDGATEKVDALLFTGGSAFGLDAAQGVMRFLKERGRGFPTLYGQVPIVPAAAIYDFSARQQAAPTADDAYAACVSADYEWKAGAVGAGTGAAVGKLLACARPMSAGFSFAEINCASGLSVMAAVVVNAIGDVIDASGNIVAGAILENGQFINTAKYLETAQTINAPLSQQNTTLVAVCSNAKFNKVQLTRIAKMASAGMARAIAPVFSGYDGDIVFALSCGELIFDEIAVGAIAATAVQRAILNAVETARPFS